MKLKIFTKKIRHFLSLVAFFFLIAQTVNNAYCQSSTANTVLVKGLVTDSKQQSLPGVTVKVDGTTTGTVTDGNGLYQIRVTKPATLVFSFIGLGTQRVVVGTNLQINITLNEATGKSLDEVVVVGYGTQKRSDITGSVASVPKTRLSQIPVTNVLQALEGSVAGVSISQGSSVPGRGPTNIVRGVNTINTSADASPLVVVDGIPLSTTGGSLNDINPNDIASIEILKDASAVAIYGTRGANGVYIVTTKRGTIGKPVIRYNSYYGLENFEHILQPLSGSGYAQKYADWYKQTQPVGTKQPTVVPNAFEVANYNAGITTDWIKLVSQQGMIQDHNLSISGGSETAKYLLSGEYLNEKGTVKGYGFKRVNIRSNLDFNVTKFLNVGTSVFFSNNNDGGSTGRADFLQATLASPYGQPYNSLGKYNVFPEYPELLYTNPLIGLLTQRYSVNNNLNGNFYAEIKPGIKGLKYRLNAAYTDVFYRFDGYTGRDANDIVGGTANTSNSESKNWVIENLLTYNLDFGKQHLDLTGLYSAQSTNYYSVSANASGFVNDQLTYYNLGAGATPSAGSYSNSRSLVSQMARLNYSYDSRYLLTLTARRDGSSVFGANTSKYGIFPSAAVGWNITHEDFMKNVSFLDNLKLRGSYGKVGFEGLNPYSTITGLYTVKFPFNGVSTTGITANQINTTSLLGNGDLRWQDTYKANIGLDFSVLKSRISGTVEVYSDQTKNIVLSRAIPNITGYTTVNYNLGQLSNKGVELTLNTANVRGEDFRWESTVVFAANRNKIIDLYGDKKSDVGNRLFIGQPLNVNYDYKKVGVWQVGENTAIDPGAKPGDLKFADINGDGKITSDDRVIQGSTLPRFTGGLTNTFHYKQFNLNVFIQTVQGVTKSNQTLNNGDEAGRRNIPAEVGYWTADNASQTRPSLAYTNPKGYGYESDASYTRIKDVTLSYVFGQKLLDKIKIGSATIYASGRNLYTFTKWVGFDPENDFNGRGLNDANNNYPLTRTFVLGLNVSLR